MIFGKGTLVKNGLTAEFLFFFPQPCPTQNTALTYQTTVLTHLQTVPNHLSVTAYWPCIPSCFLLQLTCISLHPSFKSPYPTRMNIDSCTILSMPLRDARNIINQLYTQEEFTFVKNWFLEATNNQEEHTRKDTKIFRPYVQIVVNQNVPKRFKFR